MGSTHNIQSPLLQAAAHVPPLCLPGSLSALLCYKALRNGHDWPPQWEEGGKGFSDTPPYLGVSGFYVLSFGFSDPSPPKLLSSSLLEAPPGAQGSARSLSARKPLLLLVVVVVVKERGVAVGREQ